MEFIAEFAVISALTYSEGTKWLKSAAIQKSFYLCRIQGILFKICGKAPDFGPKK
jgi:hypothetical protein